MVGSISSTSSISTTTATNATSSVSAETAALKTELATKQAELAEATTDDDKAELNDEITALKAEIAAAQTAEKQSTQQAARPNGRPDANTDRRGWEGSKPPEGKVSGEVMSVLMQLSQQGMIPPDSEMHGADRPSTSERYSEMDSDDNGTVTKDEFTAARPEHASEEEATSFFNAIDTKGTGSITEEQFTTAMEAREDERGPGSPGGHMGSPGGMPDMDELQKLLASLTTSRDTETMAA